MLAGYPVLKLCFGISKHPGTRMDTSLAEYFPPVTAPSYIKKSSGYRVEFQQKYIKYRNLKLFVCGGRGGELCTYEKCK